MPLIYGNNEKMEDLSPLLLFPKSLWSGLHAEGFSSSLYKALQLISAEVGLWGFFSQFKMHLQRCFVITTMLNCCSFLSFNQHSLLTC